MISGRPPALYHRAQLPVRPFRMAATSLACNLSYALYHGVLGVTSSSIWFLTLCVFYGILAVTRFSILLCGIRAGVAGRGAVSGRFVMRLTGVLLAALSVVLAAVNYLSLSRNIAVRYGEILMIAIAAYTSCKLTMVFVRAVRRRREPSAYLTVIHKISCAEAAASLLTLQRSMLASFGSMEADQAHIMVALTGAGVCLFVLTLSGTMIVKGSKKGW